ncbi:MAG: hypothetical protein JKY68_06665 [Rhodospirillales bacterium]|nr:hypothetical protein [Rhodospirillales bacterium]
MEKSKENLTKSTARLPRARFQTLLLLVLLLMLCSGISWIMSWQAIFATMKSMVFSAPVSSILQLLIAVGLGSLALWPTIYRYVVAAVVAPFLAISLLTGAFFSYGNSGYPVFVIDTLRTSHEAAIIVSQKFKSSATALFLDLKGQLRLKNLEIRKEIGTGDYGKRRTGCGTVCVTLKRERDQTLLELDTHQANLKSIESLVARLSKMAPALVVSELEAIGNTRGFDALFSRGLNEGIEAIFNDPYAGAKASATKYLLDISNLLWEMQPYAERVRFDLRAEIAKARVFPGDSAAIPDPIDQFGYDLLALAQLEAPKSGFTKSFYGLIPDLVTAAAALLLFMLKTGTPPKGIADIFIKAVVFPATFMVQLYFELRKVPAKGRGRSQRMTGDGDLLSLEELANKNRPLLSVIQVVAQGFSDVYQHTGTLPREARRSVFVEMTARDGTNDFHVPRQTPYEPIVRSMVSLGVWEVSAPKKNHIVYKVISGSRQQEAVDLAITYITKEDDDPQRLLYFATQLLASEKLVIEQPGTSPSDPRPDGSNGSGGKPGQESSGSEQVLTNAQPAASRNYQRSSSDDAMVVEFPKP